MQIRNLADITEEDCNIFYEAMTNCSRWLPGHDYAPAENSPRSRLKEIADGHQHARKVDRFGLMREEKMMLSVPRSLASYLKKLQMGLIFNFNSNE